jgi:hypothetical protein
MGHTGLMEGKSRRRCGDSFSMEEAAGGHQSDGGFASLEVEEGKPSWAGGLVVCGPRTGWGNNGSPMGREDWAGCRCPKRPIASGHVKPNGPEFCCENRIEKKMWAARKVRPKVLLG